MKRVRVRSVEAAAPGRWRRWSEARPQWAALLLLLLSWVLLQLLLPLWVHLAQAPVAGLSLAVAHGALAAGLAWAGALLITLSVLLLNIVARVFLRDKSPK